MKNFMKIKLIALFVVLALATACNSSGKKAIKAVDDGKVSRIEVSISGMTCAGCEQTIQTKVAKLEGVKSVKALSAMGKAFIEYSPSVTDTLMIRTAITGAGYTVNKCVTAPAAGSGN
jgi:mercuric ion transport protein